MQQVQRDPPFCVEVPRRQENVRERAKLFEAGAVHGREKTTPKPHLVKEREDRLVESRWQGAMRENESMMESLQEILKGKEMEMVALRDSLNEKDALILKLQEALGESESEKKELLAKVTEKITRLGELEDTLTEKEASESALRGQSRRDSQTHAAELQRLRRERDASQQQLREEQLQNEARINSAIAYLRGEPVSPQALEL